MDIIYNDSKDIDLTWNSGYITTAGAVIGPASLYSYSDFIEVSRGEIYAAILSGSNNTMIVSAYSGKSQSTFINDSPLNLQGSAINMTEGILYLFIIPDDIVKYIRVGKHTSTEGTYLKRVSGNVVKYLSRFDKTDKEVEVLNRLVDNLVDTGSPMDVFNVETLIDGGISGGTGAFVASPDNYYWRRTAVMPISKNSYIQVEGWHVDPAFPRVIGLYDSLSGANPSAVEADEEGYFLNGEKQFFSVFIARTASRAEPDYSNTKIIVSDGISIKNKMISSLPDNIVKAENLDDSLPARYLSGQSSLYYRNKQILLLQDIPVSDGNGLLNGDIYFDQDTGILKMKFNDDIIEVCRHRYNKSMSYVEQTDTLENANAEIILQKAAGRNIRVGAFIRSNNEILSSNMLNYIRSGQLRLDSYFSPKVLGDPTQVYNEAEYDTVYQSQSTWFFNQFGRLPSVFSYAFGYTSYAEYAKKYFLSGRNSEFNKAVDYRNHHADTWISRPSSYRWYDEAGTIGVSQALVNLSAIIDDAMSARGLVHNFTHWHQMAGYSSASPLYYTCYDTYFDMLAEKNKNNQIHFCSYGEAVEYLVFREAITGIKMSEEGGKLKFTVSNRLTDFEKTLIHTPVTIKINLSGTILQNKNVSVSGGTLYSQTGNTILIEILPEDEEDVIIS